MEAVLRGASIYVFLLIVFRLAGSRTLAEVGTFDFVLLLIIGESTQQALLGNDFSVTNAFLVILTLVGIEVFTSKLESRWPRFGKWIGGTPVVIVDDGRPLADRMRKARVDESEILEAARRLQGLERMDQIKYAVLEQSGGITIIPKGPKP